MSQAKASKLKEYGTDILSHDSTGAGSDQVNVRFNNTFKSSVMDTQPEAPRTLTQAKSRERVFSDKIFAAKVQRASYQDSNIFGYKDQYDETVQQAASRDEAQQKTRYNPTFSSRVFAQQSGPDESDRPSSATRREEKWQSTVFAGPLQESSKRKKLGQGDAGTDTLFGQDRIDFDNKSNNMTVLGTKKAGKQWKPVRQQKTAEQRKAEELHGRSAAIYGVGKKKDGTLMSNNADWRNLQQTHVNSSVKQQQDNKAQTCKDKKFGNLQSDIFGTNEGNGIPAYNPNVEKASFGSDANWSAQGGASKVINKGYKQDAYKKKQQQLSSQVFEQTDYSEYQPMNKPKLDFNNMTDKQRQNDHLYSDILGNQGQTQSQRNIGLKASEVSASSNWQQQDVKQQISKDYTQYTAKNQNVGQMKSSLDTHTYEASPQRGNNEQEAGPQVTIPGNHSTATKMRDLSSDVLMTGNTIQHYQNVDKPTVVVDFDVKGLPQNVKSEDLKKISGAKHVISAVVDEDAIRNICTGTGRIKLRLGGEDDIDNVKLQFLKAGYGIQEHSDNPKKNSGFTQEQTLSVKSPNKLDMDSKATKQSNLQTNNPEVFGNNASHQNKYSLNFDAKEVNQNKNSAQTESHAISTWNKVGGKR